jgi:hypothetical protein
MLFMTIFRVCMFRPSSVLPPWRSSGSCLPEAREPSGIGPPCPAAPIIRRLACSPIPTYLSWIGGCVPAGIPSEVPRDGTIRVWYAAGWKGAVTAAGRGARRRGVLGPALVGWET